MQPIICTAVAACYIIGQSLARIVHHPHPIYYYYDNHYQDNGPWCGPCVSPLSLRTGAWVDDGVNMRIITWLGWLVTTRCCTGCSLAPDNPSFVRHQTPGPRSLGKVWQKLSRVNFLVKV